MDKKDFYTALEKRGLLNYGSTIPKHLVHKLLEIEVPEVGTQKKFQELALLEVGAVDYVRNILLGQGKYLSSAKQNGYRVLLPSENNTQVESYMASADKKLRRALKLYRNTPSHSGHSNDNSRARLLLKRDNISEQRRHLKDLS